MYEIVEYKTKLDAQYESNKKEKDGWSVVNLAYKSGEFAVLPYIVVYHKAD